jgi:hypothetical protein
MRSSLCILVLAVVFLCSRLNSGAQPQLPPALPSPAAAGQIQTNGAAPLREQGFATGTNGTLYLKFPAGWQENHQHVADGARSHELIFFTSTNEWYFNFAMEVYPFGESYSTNRAQLKTRLLEQGTNALTNVVEKTVELRDFKGAQATGSYFRLTDKKWALVSPPESEAKYLTQGYASVGPLVLPFRLLSNHPTVQEAAVLEVIKTARYSENSPAGIQSK